jgi:TRAP-type uncharacterized transport system substrate-binding protein
LETTALSWQREDINMRVAAAMLAGMLIAAPGLAQEAKAPPQPVPVSGPQQKQIKRAKLNQETLVIAASRPGTADLAMASDLSSAIGSSGNVRVLAVAADGALANLRDLLFLRGVDMAIVPSNALAHARATNAFGNALPQKVAYVTALYSEEVHVVAGQGITVIGDLAGKRIAVPAEDATAQFTAGDIFHHLGVAVEVVPMAPADAPGAVRTGRVAAAVLVARKPEALVSALPKDGSLRLLSLPMAAMPGDGYSPAVLLPEDYPALIPPGAIVESLAVRSVLMAGRGDEAARRVAKHTPAVLDAIAHLAASSRHPKWRDVNLGAVLPGWTRVEAAETWLKQASAQRREARQGHFGEAVRVERRVKSSDLSGTQSRKLLDEFEVWARQSVSGEPAAK